MSRKSIFIALRFFHMLIDRVLMSIFGSRFRQQYVRLSYQIKTRLFPEYGSYIPTNAEIGSLTQHAVWLPPAIPEWVLSEMRDLGREIDPILYPTDRFIASCQYYSYPVIPKPGKVYEQLLQQCTSEHYSHCFAIPWLKRGGADFVALKHITFANQQPNAKVLVLLTELGDSPWLSRIPDGVDILNIAAVSSEISHEDLLLIISRLFVQLKIDVLHIINSRHVWDVVCKYGLAIRQQTTIFASIYCDDYDKWGQPVGFARQYLPQCYKHITKVFSDNEAFPRMLREVYGYRPEFFSVLKSPIAVLSSSVVERNPRGKKVLWAGRLDRQKRPDLLLAIVRAMPDVTFEIYGDALLDSKSTIINDLKKSKNVTMRGGFDGVESLPFKDFSVFLYTSQWDGTPTMVIAAALASIPIVASCVGGVGDIINESTGYPVRDIENISLYVSAIYFALDNTSEAEKRALVAKQYVEQEHADSVFEIGLINIQDYLPPHLSKDNANLVLNEEK